MYQHWPMAYSSNIVKSGVLTVYYIAPECCTLQMQPSYATNNYVEYCIQNITIKP